MDMLLIYVWMRLNHIDDVVRIDLHVMIGVDDGGYAVYDDPVLRAQ